MFFKRITRLVASVIIISAMVTGLVPACITGAATDINAEGQEVQPPAATDTQDLYLSTDKQEVIKLLGQEKFTVSNPAVNMTPYENYNGVLVSGNSASIAESRFTFEEEIDFGTQSPGYIVADGLANKKKNLELSFYLDNEEEPFVSVKLNSIKRKDYWNYKKNACQSIKNKNITGKHKVSFRAVTDDANNVKFFLRYIFFMNNDIPVLDFDIDESEGSIGEMNGDQSHNTECYGKVSVKIPEGYKPEYTSKEQKPGTYNLEYIRGRGNSTWYSDKKPYKFKLTDSTDFFGMGKNKHWILLANYYDVTMIRNKFTYWLGAEMGMKYTPQCIFTDVIMNGQYIGSYYLCEQIRIGKNRINIDDLEADDAAKGITTGPAITGGYLLTLSPYTENDSMKRAFTTDGGLSFGIQSPGFDDYFNQAQYDYISGYIQKTEDAILGEGFKDASGIPYSEYMDVDAAIDYYWVQEISKNGDAYISSSTYLYKERNGKLFWGPLWDFDYVAWGDTSFYTEGFNIDNIEWFSRLLMDKTFAGKLIARWPAFKEKLLYACKDGGQIDQYAAQIYNSQKANFNVNDLYNESWMMEDDDSGQQEKVTFESEVLRLKQWISDRVKWIDENIDILYPTEFKITYMSDGKVYKEGTYTRNGRNGIVFPEPPVKEGYVFKGWYTKETTEGKEEETPLTEGIIIDEDITACARWVEAAKIVKASGISFGQDEITYYNYDENPVPPLYTLPFDSEVPEVVYKSSDESIVNIIFNEMSKRFEMYTSEPGDATITAVTKDGLEASCLIHVISYDGEIPSGDFSLSHNEITIENGGYDRVCPKFSYNKIPYLDYIFDISDNSIAEVNGAGYIHAKKAGTAYIGVKCNRTDNIKFCKVTVTEKEAKFTSKGLIYKIIKTDTSNEIVCTGLKDKDCKSIKIPGTVIYKNSKYKVTAIEDGAFKGCKKLKKAVIGKNITKIGKKAFYNCKSLKLLDIKSVKLKKAGKNATGKVPTDFKIKAPSGKYNEYLKLFK